MSDRPRVRAPGPTPLPEEARQAMAREPGYHRTESFSAVIEEVVRRLRTLLDVDWPVVPLAASGTGAMEMAVQNTVGPGDRAVVIKGGKFAERWERMVETAGADVVPVDVEWGNTVDPGDVRTVLETEEDIRAVFGTMVETSTLVRHPVEEIGTMMTERDPLFVVDAISAAGTEPLPAEELGMDLVVLGAQKGLMGPPGLSFVGASPRAVERSREMESPTTYFDLPSAVDRLKSDCQTPWTPPMQLLYAQRASLDILFEEGPENAFQRHQRLARGTRKAVREAGLSLFSERSARAGTALELPGTVDGEKLRQHLLDEHNTFIPGGQKQYVGRLLRIGHLGDVDRFDVLGALTAVMEGLREMGVDGELDRALSEAKTILFDHDEAT